MRHSIRVASRFLVLSLFAAAVASWAGSAHAANRWWDGGTVDIVGNGNSASGGTAGTWDTTIQNWDAGAVPHVAWVNSNNDTAIFAGTAGTVTAGSSLVAGNLSVTGAYSFAGNNNNLTLNGTGTTINAGTLSGFNIITLGASQTWTATVSGGSVDTNGNTLSLGAGSMTSVISGNGNLTRLSTATSAHTLNAANTYTGVTTVNGTGAMGDSVTTVIITSLKNAGLNSEFGASTSTASANLVLNGAVIRTGATATSNRGLTITGNNGFYVKGAYTQTLTGAITGTGNLSTDGDYSGGAAGGSGNLVLAGNNDFTGDVLFQTDSRITLNHQNAVSKATLSMSGTRILANLTTNNLAYVIGGLKGSVNLNLGTGLGGGGGGAVSIGNNGQSNIYSGALSGTAGFTKIGNGVQTLTGVNLYTGPTTVSAGTLTLSGAGSIYGSPTINVAALATFNVSAVPGGYTLGTVTKTQTLKGTGTIVGPLTIGAYGIHAPGNSTGIETVKGDYTMSGQLQSEIQGSTADTGYDQVLISDTASRNVSLSGSLSLAWSGTGWSSLTDKLWIVKNDTAGSIAGTFSNYLTNGMSVGNYDGKTWNIWYGADFATGNTSGGNDVLLAPVPEPSTLVLLAASLVGLLAYAWKKRK